MAYTFEQVASLLISQYNISSYTVNKINHDALLVINGGEFRLDDRMSVREMKEKIESAIKG